MPNWEFAQISNHYIIGHAQAIFLKFKLKNKYMSLPYLYKKRKWIISLTFVSSGKILLRRREFGRVTESQSHGAAQPKRDTVQMMHFPKNGDFSHDFATVPSNHGSSSSNSVHSEFRHSTSSLK